MSWECLAWEVTCAQRIEGFGTDLRFKRMSRESPLHKVRSAIPADGTARSKAQKMGHSTVRAGMWAQRGSASQSFQCEVTAGRGNGCRLWMG